MLPAIQFDNQPCFNANKIHNVRTNTMLPTEFEAVQLAVAQFTPQPFFYVGLPDSQGTGVFCLLLWMLGHFVFCFPLALTLSPEGRGNYRNYDTTRRNSTITFCSGVSAHQA